MTDYYVLLKELWVIWFMILFLGIVAWVYWPANRKSMQDHAEIPLRDDASRHQSK